MSLLSLVPDYNRAQHMRGIVHNCAKKIRAERAAKGCDDDSSLVGEVTSALAGTEHYKGFDIYEVEAIVRATLSGDA